MNNDDFTTVKIIAKIYNGFQHKIKTDKFIKMSSQEIVDETKTVMKCFFQQHNLSEGLYLVES